MRAPGGIDSKPCVPDAPGRSANGAGPTREDVDLPFWRKAGADARAAGLERAANPFLRMASCGPAGLPFAVSSACSSAWLEGWKTTDEGVPGHCRYHDADRIEGHPSSG